MTNWIIEKFKGSGGIRTHDLRVTSPLLYQLHYLALGAVREWIPINMAHVTPVTCHRYHMCHVNRDSLTHCSQGSVAQLVEQQTSNPKVVGSNPTWATEFFNNSVGHYQCRLSSLMLPWGWFWYRICLWRFLYIIFQVIWHLFHPET